MGRILLLATLVAQAGPAADSLFTFRSEFWSNLHHFLYVLGRARAGFPDAKREAVRHAVDDVDGMDGLDKADLLAWDAAVAYYQDTFSRKDTVFDRDLVKATQTLAAGSPDLGSLLDNLASTTTLLANDRDQAVTALASLTNLAQAADYSLTTYKSSIDREIKQVDAVTATVASSLDDLQTLLDWMQRFSVAFPKGIYGNYGGIYLRVVPYVLDPRSPK